MEDPASGTLSPDSAGDELPELELTDGDILDAMQHIPGYLDITTEDFRIIYHLAHRHAVGRLFDKAGAAGAMQAEVAPLLPEMSLDEAVKALVRSGCQALPVVDSEGRQLGLLLRKDFFGAYRLEDLP